MLKYNYLIIRDEGDEIIEYKPSLIPKELSDVVYIEGPNSSGKSTLLNLIALGFFGLKMNEDELNPELHEKLDYLINSDHQKVQFTIEISNDALSTTLLSTKSNIDNKEFVVREKVENNEKPIIPEQFKKKYKLIYDIPDNPLARLEQLLVEIKNSQETKGRGIALFREYIRDVIHEVKNAQDPVLLDQNRTKLKDDIKEYKKIEIEVEDKKILHDNIEKFLIVKYYQYYKESFEGLDKRLKELSESKKKISRIEVKQSKEQAKIYDKYEEKRKNAECYYRSANSLLKSLIPDSKKHLLEIWRISNCSNEIKEPDVYDSLRTVSEKFINILKDLRREDNEKVDVANFYRKLYELLSDYRNSNFTIPGVKKNINEFLSLLEKEIMEYEGVSNINKNITNCINYLEKMKLNIENGIIDFLSYKNIIKNYPKPNKEMNEVSINYEYNEIMAERKKVERKFCDYRSELLKNKIPESNVKNVLEDLKFSKDFHDLYQTYDKYTEEQLFDKNLSLKNEIDSLIQEKNRLKRTIDWTEDEIKRIEKKQPHIYQNYLSELEKYQKITHDLEKKMLVTFNENIKEMMNKNIKTTNLDIEKKKYAEHVAEYLAEKKRYIKHIDKNYRVKKIDIINKVIIAECGKEIKFTDLGTGQSHGAYLETLLSMNDDRKIIALFDEVAMMDSTTLQPIFDKLRELYNNKQLLLGVIVQKADKVKVKSLV